MFVFVDGTNVWGAGNAMCWRSSEEVWMRAWPGGEEKWCMTIVYGWTLSSDDYRMHVVQVKAVRTCVVSVPIRIVGGNSELKGDIQLLNLPGDGSV